MTAIAARGRPGRLHRHSPALCLGLALAILAGPAMADTSCRRENFAEWVRDVRAEAAAKGMSASTLAALASVKQSPKILTRDRTQPSLSQSFVSFAGRLVSNDRISRGRALLAKHAKTIARIERDYGVPGPVVAAFWGLETDFGAFMGSFDSLDALATLAYDCRRPDYFREELLAALTLLDRGDLRRSEMRGAWAGELGQVQFTPTNYLKYAVDFDGDGRRDLVSSVPDALASAAHYLVSLGWRPNAPWLEEVAVPTAMDWSQAGRAIRHPRRYWAGEGVRRGAGSPLPADGAEAALVLPMGRTGPAFLAYPNFDVFWDWNNSSNYSLAAAYFATRLAGAPTMAAGSGVTMLTAAEMAEVQTRLNRAGYDAGPADGRLGQKTRDGVRAAQIALGLAPDGFPTKELLERLRAGR